MGAPRSASAMDSGQPIFTKPESSVIPGELLVRLREDAAAAITNSIPTGPSRGHSAPGPMSFGVSALDRVMQELKASSVLRLTPPLSPTTAMAEEAVAISSTFRVRYEANVDAVAAAERMSRADGVEYAEPNRYRETSVIPNDPSFATQWGLTKINCPAAWDRTTGSPNITVAVIDSGVDLDHPELAALLVPGTDMVDLGANPAAPPGFHFEGDFTGRDNDPQDEVGHGTHVAGTIACATNNGTGVAGVTWNCRIMPVRVLARIVNNNNPADVRGVGSAADIAAGIRWAVDRGARVLNLSLGGTVDTQVERDAIAYAVSRGAVVVAAMGNAFLQGNPTSFPAAYPGVVAVGAIDQNDQRAPFSQTGPHISVVAPGVGILSTVWDNGFATMQGTSMASPHVAGVAALILSCNSALTGAQVGDILRQTARPLRQNPGDPVPNPQFGSGCVDAAAAINRACPRRPSVPVLTCPVTSTTVRCRPSRPVISCPSVITCPPPTRPIQCRTLPAFCPSAIIICRSVQLITCGVTSRPVCGPPRGPGPGPGPRPGPLGAGSEEDWSAYDPYAYWYGEEEEEEGGCDCG